MPTKFDDNEVYSENLIWTGRQDFEHLRVGGNRLFIQDTQPTDAKDGDVWIDTSQ